MAKDGIFELNGNAYDALTGELLGDARHIQRSTPDPVKHVPIRERMQQAAQSAQQHRSPVVIGGLSAAHSTNTHKRGQAAANHVTAHQPQPTKTLMRQAVKPPTVQPKAARPSAIVGAHSNAIHASRTTPSAAQPAKSGVMDMVRVHRAHEAPRSKKVQHFQSPSIPQKPVYQAQAIVQQPTAQPLTAQPKAAPIKLVHPQQPVSNRLGNRSVMQRRQLQQAQQLQRPATSVAPLAPQPTRQAVHHQPSPVSVPPQQHQAVTSEQDLFSQALAHATSHEEQAPHESTVSKIKHKGKKRKRVFSIAATAVVFLALCGFVAVQNKENIQVQLAGAKAGFSVATPLYKPSGYTLSKMTSTSGSVASLYKNTGNQSFTLTQKKSNWDSQTLLENFVASSHEDYKGFQSNGRTVYVYGKGKATWVNAGIWYQIQGADDLTNDQLVKIAASM